jgi:hypothetical protein
MGASFVGSYQLVSRQLVFLLTGTSHPVNPHSLQRRSKQPSLAAGRSTRTGEPVLIADR